MTRHWTRPTRITWWAVGVAVVLTAGTAAYLASVYPSLPRGVPVQYVMDRPYIFERKSPVMVMLPVLVQLGLMTTFGSIMLLLLWRAKPASAGLSTSRDTDLARMGLAAEGIALIAAVWIAVQALGAVRLMVLWRGTWGGFGTVYSLAMVAAIVTSIVVMARTIRLVGRHRNYAGAENPKVWRLLLAVTLVMGVGGPWILARYILHGYTL